LLVAEKKYSYGNYDYLNESGQKKNKRVNRKENKKKNLLIKMSFMFWVIVIASAFIFILLRYTAITEAKYNVYSLNKEIKKLEDHLQEVKVELDSLTRSDIIEEAAVKDLNMQYPQYDQMVFLPLDDTPDLDLTVYEEYNSADEQSLEEQNKDNSFLDYLKVPFKKLYSLLD